MAVPNGRVLRSTKNASTPTAAKTDAETAHVKTRYTNLVVELMATCLDLLTKVSAESSPFATNTPSDSHISAFKSAFKNVGFSEGYAEEIIGGATVRVKAHDETRKRRRRLIMFEKQVRQVADTVKRMASDVPQQMPAQTSPDGRTRLGDGDTTGNAPAEVQQLQHDDELLFAELLRLVNESRIWITSVPKAMHIDDEGCGEPLYTSEHLDERPPPGPKDTTSGPTHSTSWYDGPPSAQIIIEPKAKPATRRALARNDKDSQSQPPTPEGFGWDDLLPEIVD
ncbi:hypothetical protein LTR84_012602 [Exophiala bonariae]|uniref:Mediator complex subunit 11 n=1 Tax=Exophiala bonariae TaxID=1690606 RepID=A0AAV9NI56_9EURO|nr:hypothetical protein LTR84_012602 [Exophiala bonariae]